MCGILTVGSLDVRVKGEWNTGHRLLSTATPWPRKELSLQLSSEILAASWTTSAPFATALSGRSRPHQRSRPDPSPAPLRSNARHSMFRIHCTDPFEHLLGRLSVFSSSPTLRQVRCFSERNVHRVGHAQRSPPPTYPALGVFEALTRLRVVLRGFSAIVAQRRFASAESRLVEKPLPWSAEVSALATSRSCSSWLRRGRGPGVGNSRACNALSRESPASTISRTFLRYFWSVGTYGPNFWEAACCVIFPSSKALSALHISP